MSANENPFAAKFNRPESATTAKKSKRSDDSTGEMPLPAKRATYEFSEDVRTLIGLAKKDAREKGIRGASYASVIEDAIRKTYGKLLKTQE
ncbi:hypothetical protein [Acaricomes phytoseiuli]|uniref:hypothetical protein n=1 Tax=Acaricomes phytoseiuli TaxID=291968 RepID=UPI00037936F8|nr:hypothetical protein [Acaricomes phytoseiuli]